MKPLIFFTICALSYFTITTVQAQNDMNVHIDSEPNLDLSDYDSYFWVTDFSNDEDLWITINSIQGEMIKEAVDFEMDVKGLEWNPKDADLLVNFHIFDKDYDKKYYIGNTPYEYRYMDKQETMNDIKDGTVVISLIDKENGDAIWEGYATIPIEEDESLREQQADIRRAVAAIFDRYNPMK